MKKIFALALVFALLILAVSCNSTVERNTETNKATESLSGDVTEIVTNETTGEQTTITIETESAKDPDDNKVEITDEFTITTTVEDGYTVEDDVYTITKEGEYTLSGSLSGRIEVSVTDDEKVTLVLNGVSITCDTDSPIKCLSADSLKIKVEADTYNVLTDSRDSTYVASDTSGKGCIYTKCDLTLSGKGSLVVTGTYNNGIHTTKDLEIKNVTLKVTAFNNALKGNDSVTIESGNLIVISTGGDGIETEDSDVSSKGNQRGTVTISGGTIDIYAACDGIDAAYDVIISGENTNVNVYTDTYSEYTGERATNSGEDFYIVVSSAAYKGSYKYVAYYYNSDINSGVWEASTFEGYVYSGRTQYYCFKLTKPSGYSNACYFVFSGTDYSTDNYVAVSEAGTINSSMNAYVIKSISGQSASGDYAQLSTSGSSVSTKGIKADNSITISGATICVSSTDDAIHSNSDVQLENESYGLGNVTVKSGNLVLKSGDDALHADNVLTIEGGSIVVKDSYEGLEGNVINICGGNLDIYARDDGMNAKKGNATPCINISGGSILVTTASGDTDGIDSNGNIVITGGVTIVQAGSSMGGVSGSIDLDGTITVKGGTVIALGGICETPSGSSNENVVIISGKTFSKGNYVIKDSSGNTVLEFSLSGSYSNAWIASESFNIGETYTIYSGSTNVYSWTQSSQSVGQSGGQGRPGWRW